MKVMLIRPPHDHMITTNVPRSVDAETGMYPPRLKARIRGDRGHLSNHDAAQLLRACGRRKPKWVAVAHLSRENNRPELAIGAQHAAVGEHYPVYHASRCECTERLSL